MLKLWLRENKHGSTLQQPTSHNSVVVINIAIIIIIIIIRDGRIVIFCWIPDSVNRRLISGRFWIWIFCVTLPLLHTYKKLQQIVSNAIFFCNL